MHFFLILILFLILKEKINEIYLASFYLNNNTSVLYKYI